jgi:hypothetical protein
MANCIIGYPIVSDVNAIYTPVFDRGAWTLPLTNLQNRQLDLIARSASAAIADTQFGCHLMRQARVLALALIKHNISQAGKVRVRGFSAMPVFDTLTVADGAWTINGTVVRTPGLFTCSDGIPLDLVEDNDGVFYGSAGRVVPFAIDGVKTLRVRVARNSAYANQIVEILDNTSGGAGRLVISVNFTAVQPVVSVFFGTLVSVTDRGDGSYEIVAHTSAITAAHSNVLYIAPAGVNAADTASFYVGDIMAFDGIIDELQFEGGIRPAWPVVYPAGSLNAGDPRIGGTYTPEEALDIQPDFIVVPPTAVNAWHWLVEVLDPTNPAGHIDIGRLVIANGFQPTLNMLEGAKIDLSTASTREESDGGAAIFDEKDNRRTAAFTVEGPEDEMLANIYEFKRRVGITGSSCSSGMARIRAT